MANTFATLNTALLAQRSLQELVLLFPLLTRISTNFSSEALFNQSVNVRLAKEVAAQSYSTSNGYVSQDSDEDEVSVTMDQHIHVTRSLNVQEAHSTDRELLTNYARLDAASIAKHMFANLLGKVVAADIPDTPQKTTAAVGAFGRDTFVDVGVAMELRDVSSAGRLAMLNPTYFGQLKKDTTIISTETTPGNTTVRTGRVLPVDEFDVMKFNTLTDNSENLEGFAGAMDSFAAATRLPDLEKLAGLGFNNYRSTVVTEESSGISILVVEYVDPQKGTFERSYRLMYGTALGNKATIQRIASA